MQKIQEDKDLGIIRYRKYRQAKQYTIRICNGQIRVSLPYLGSYRQAAEFLDKNREVLKRKLEALPKKEKLSLEQQSELKKEARCILPEKLKQLALSHGFQYNQVKIGSSRSRWGSCSSRKNINLSFFLITLPEHLINYVLLHELCHTVEMNHGPAFWKLMDTVCVGQSKQLRRELKSFMIA